MINFKVGDIYRNRKGQYTVLALSETGTSPSIPIMQVKYSDGTISTVTVEDSQRDFSPTLIHKATTRKNLAEAQERQRKLLGPARRKADMEQGWFPPDRPEPEHQRDCSKTGTCLICG
jgi:hypothetical protein